MGGGEWSLFTYFLFFSHSYVPILKSMEPILLFFQSIESVFFFH